MAPAGASEITETAKGEEATRRRRNAEVAWFPVMRDERNETVRREVLPGTMEARVCVPPANERDNRCARQKTAA